LAYIGQRPVIGRYIKLDQISSGFNGSNTGFSMTAGSQAVFPGTARNLLLSLGGVIQEPDTDFTISGSTLTFTTPPVANTTFFGVIYGDMQATGTPSDGTVLPASIASSGNFSFPQLTVTTDLTISSASPKIFLTDTGQNPDYTVSNTDGIFKIISSDGGGTDKIKINTDGHVDITGNLDCEAGLDVTGGGLTVNTGAVNTCATFTSSDSGAVINLTDNSARSSIEQNGTDFKIISDTDAGDDNSTIKFQVDASTKMTILSSGNVGIGTVSPNAKLTICETGTLTGGDINLNADGLVIDNNGGNTGITFKTPNSASSRIAFGDPEDNNVGQIVYNHSTDDLTITAADNIVLDGDSVGIGTSSVDRKFHVEGTDNVLLKLQNNQTVCLMEFQDTDTTSGNRPAMGADGNNAVFYTGGVPTMVIDSSGRVGIGTSSPTVTLDLESNTPVLKFTDANATGTPETEVSGAGGNLTLSADKDNEKADTAIICQCDGSTVISVTHNAQTEFEVGSTALFQRNTGGSNSTAVLFMSAGSEVGKIFFNNSTTIYSPSASDRRAKKNFENWTESVLPLFKNLTPQKFHFTQEEDSETKHKGFIAQDEVASFPEAYPKDPDTDKYLYSPNNMVVYLMKAIQELEAEVAALKAA